VKRRFFPFLFVTLRVRVRMTGGEGLAMTKKEVMVR